MNPTVSRPSMARTASRLVLGTLWLVAGGCLSGLVDGSGTRPGERAGHGLAGPRAPAHAQGEARDILAQDGRTLASSGDEQARTWPALAIGQ